jgi:hypothetical protein
MTTLLIEDQVISIPQGKADGENFWVPLADLQTTGWELKPEGACKGEFCVPIPRGREEEFAAHGAFNLGLLATYLGQPIVHDAGSDTVVIGESADVRTTMLRSLQAPDFTLPDLDGRMHSLSDYRGRKIFLVSWASW